MVASMLLPDFTLRGDDVVLRPLTLADADALAAAASQSRDTFQWTWVPDGIAETRAMIGTALRQRREGTRYPFVTVFRGEVVGWTSYFRIEFWDWPEGHSHAGRATPDAVEIGGTWLSQSAQRTRCNTQAKRLMLRHAFETWNVHRVHFETDERNTRSRNAIARLGAKLEGIRRADRPGRDGIVRNSARYSIVAAEWPDVEENLRKMLA
jgi:RimJ/RimL family protein N-acetyltransferase